MVRKNMLMNMGLCMGVVNAPAFCPKPGVAKLDVAIRAERQNPKTKKYPMQVLNFVAYGEMAEQVSQMCKKGCVVWLEYHLEDRLIISRSTGVGKFQTDLVIHQISVRDEKHSSRVCYRNEGVLDGVFLGIEKVPNTESVYTLDVLHTDMQKRRESHFRFYVYGSFGQTVKDSYSKGQPVTVAFKVEKLTKVRENEKSAYFTNLVMERLY